ncbi:MAG: hypothetical protein K1X83_13955 [Oligoflexia bacterium]|nr:hypothetical protein [Oligoflexia bacterium]
MAKSQQLQIRVSAEEKRIIQKRAAAARLDISKWILSQVLAPGIPRFHALVSNLSVVQNKQSALADLNDFLAASSRKDLELALSAPPKMPKDRYLANYLAAMIEQACVQAFVQPPAWLSEIEPLGSAVFGSPLQSLRLYLLSNSPAPFRRRNIFIDSSIGARV